jgi:flagellar hook-associated protein 2
VQRSSNTISDVIAGVTFNLNSPVTPAGGEISLLSAANFSAVSSTTINVTKSEKDSATEVVQNFVTAFNDLLTYYAEQAASSTDAETRGLLRGDFSTSTFIDRLRGLYRNGLRLADGTSMSFSEMGVSVQRDGKLLLNDSTLAEAIATRREPLDRAAQQWQNRESCSWCAVALFLPPSLPPSLHERP